MLRTDAPQVLLLMEGVNDLADGPSGVRAAASALDAMVAEARLRGVQVLLATIPPQRPGAPKGHSAATVPLLNDQIRRIAIGQAVTLVDIFALFGGDLSLLGPDGLHPTQAGYDRIANWFFDTVRSRFEVSITSAGMTPLLRPPTGETRQ